MRPRRVRAKQRPAEVAAGAAGAVAALIVYFTGADATAVLVPLIVVIGAVPAAVTWAVETFKAE